MVQPVRRFTRRAYFLWTAYLVTPSASAIWTQFHPLIHRSLNGGGLEPVREPTKRHDRGERFGRVAGVWHLR